jgi:hypothetical protein
MTITAMLNKWLLLFPSPIWRRRRTSPWTLSLSLLRLRHSFSIRYTVGWLNRCNHWRWPPGLFYSAIQALGYNIQFNFVNPKCVSVCPGSSDCPGSHSPESPPSCDMEEWWCNNHLIFGIEFLLTSDRTLFSCVRRPNFVSFVITPRPRLKMSLLFQI